MPEKISFPVLLPIVDKPFSSDELHEVVNIKTIDTNVLIKYFVIVFLLTKTSMSLMLI